MPKELSPKQNQVARIDNRILEAFIKNNDNNAFKVLLYIGKAQLDKKIDIEELDDDKLYKIPIRLNPIKDYYNLNTRKIREGIKKLNRTSINYRRIEGCKDTENFVNLLPKVKINYTDEVFECYVFGEVLKLIYAITAYSKINVKNFIGLKHKHSARMLLLLERISNYKKVKIYTDPETLKQTKVDVMPKRQHYELDELNKMFGTKYPSYSLFIKRVIEPTKKDLDMNSKLTFEYRAIKDRVGDKVKSRGRTPIIHITIDVVDNRQNLFAQ